MSRICQIIDYHILLEMLDWAKFCHLVWWTKKWFKICGVEDLLDLSSDGMWYVVIWGKLNGNTKEKVGRCQTESLKYYIANQPWMLRSIYAHSIIVAIISTNTISIIKSLKMKQYCKTMHFQFLPWPTYVFFKKALCKFK